MRFTLFLASSAQIKNSQQKHAREVNQVTKTDRELRRRELAAKCPPQGVWPSCSQFISVPTAET